MKPKIITVLRLIVLILLLAVLIFMTVSLAVGKREDKLTEEDILKRYENVRLCEYVNNNGSSGETGDLSPPAEVGGVQFFADKSIFSIGDIDIQYRYGHGLAPLLFPIERRYTEDWVIEGGEGWNKNLLPYHVINVSSYYYDVSDGIWKEETKMEHCNVRFEEHPLTNKYSLFYNPNIEKRDITLTEEMFRYDMGVIIFVCMGESTVDNAVGNKIGPIVGGRLYYRKIKDKIVMDDNYDRLYEDLITKERGTCNGYHFKI